ncbi:NapC/NirT family cytochrome c [Thioclava sp. A2]|uniref:NapC/NirT family cytochrome c n=1 Tax=Thioclava sp. FCG-A2 TaxID=3080562 RepID=UPI002952E6B5|nr:NapC/NirT family cytochrome c [Thioclava sp. A2]MDV7272283.1 NapC/NirT family cytochrome c [Thioclava sp. A2]
MLSFIRRLFRWYLRPSVQIGQGILLTIGIGAGIVLWGGFNTAMEATNTLEFCISCHEMEDTVYQEYKTSVHYKNPAGVRAVCSDCHVPHEWGPKVVRKIKASNEILHKLLGTINTPEKFEAKRAELAGHVWETMKANDSRECRNCHSFDAMDFEHQARRAREKMEPVALGTDLSEGSTCIDCHKGIAHKLPKVERDD